jgi:hypothetical protein
MKQRIELDNETRQAVIDVMLSTKDSITEDLHNRISKQLKVQIKEDLENIRNEHIASVKLEINNSIKEAIKEIDTEQIKPMQKLIYNVAMEIRFVKWAGYSFATFLAFIGFDKFTNLIKNLFNVN